MNCHIPVHAMNMPSICAGDHPGCKLALEKKPHINNIRETSGCVYKHLFLYYVILLQCLQ